jgi:hypothetical protein
MDNKSNDNRLQSRSYPRIAGVEWVSPRQANRSVSSGCPLVVPFSWVNCVGSVVA